MSRNKIGRRSPRRCASAGGEGGLAGDGAAVLHLHLHQYRLPPLLLLHLLHRQPVLLLHQVLLVPPPPLLLHLLHLLLLLRDAVLLVRLPRSHLQPPLLLDNEPLLLSQLLQIICLRKRLENDLSLDPLLPLLEELGALRLLLQLNALLLIDPLALRHLVDEERRAVQLLAPLEKHLLLAELARLELALHLVLELLLVLLPVLVGPLRHR
mmetsp:Transcript_4677/g.10712  ORF Transcript_4677/g.10712 Transcript_4677/m.10712 type:complete len:210 (+) Transcript_4677:33-662(+)